MEMLGPLHPPLDFTVGEGKGEGDSWEAGWEGGCKLSLREGRPLERASAAALITFSPDLISRSGFCNFFQFST